MIMRPLVRQIFRRENAPMFRILLVFALGLISPYSAHAKIDASLTSSKTVIDSRGATVRYSLEIREGGSAILNVEGPEGKASYPVSELENRCNTSEADKCFDVAIAHLLRLQIIEDFSMEKINEARQDKYSKALGAFLRGCDGGHAMSCTEAGMFYERGLSLDKDLAKATSLYQRACNASIPYACYNLARFFANGLGIDQDLTKGVAMFEQACDAGMSQGCFDAAYYYREGLGVSQDVLKAASFYKRACDAGGQRGCAEYGTAVAEGVGADQDLQKAASLFRGACDADVAAGCYYLGIAYAKGNGIQRDLVKAKSFVKRACDGGDKGACNSLGYFKGQQQ